MTLRVAVLIPCRDEAAVLGRKIRNTLALAYPGPGPHAVIVVDDHSRDGSMEAAFRAVPNGKPGIDLRYVRSRRPPGKTGAIAAGLEAAASFDAVVLTDADVLLEERAVLRLAERLADPRVGIATGEPRYVREIEGAAAMGSGETLYDRLTRAVRRFESRRGSVFSVHGECLAMRPADGLVPGGGIASDDLDLALAARLRGLRVALAEGALFFEARPATREGQRAQELRRARSFVQFVVRRAGALFDRRLPIVERLRLLAYFALPIAASFLAGAILVAAGALALFGAGRVRWLPLAAILLLLALPPVRDLARRLAVLGRAVVEHALGRRASDRWEPPR